MTEPSSAQIQMLALDMLEASLNAPTQDEAALEVRARLDELDPVTARRVATALAVIGTWQMGSRKRRRGLQEWIERARLEAMWVAS